MGCGSPSTNHVYLDHRTFPSDRTRNSLGIGRNLRSYKEVH